MAFFGLTNLGYQNPIRDKLIVNPNGASRPQDGGINSEAGLPSSVQAQQGTLRYTDTRNHHQQSLPSSTDIHHGSHERYKEMVRRIQTPRSPHQLYKMPITDSQQYGWTMYNTPEPWTQVKRFPRKNSEMTKFTEEMSLNNQDFSML